MAWRPLVVGDRRAALVAVIRDIVAAVDEIAATTVDQHVDRAILHAYVAHEEVAPDPDDRCGTALASAVTELLRSPTAPGLLGGAAGLGWAVAQLAEDETAELVCRRIDQMLLRLLADWRGPYDLVGGLVGFGVYALGRGEPGHALAVRVCEELSRRARSLGDGLAWHTPPGELAPRQQSDAPGGVWNLGLAHGVPGVIALLARYLTAGVDVERARELLDGAVAFMLAAEAARDDGRYPAWLVGGPEGPDQRQPHRECARLAWCYNDLGVAIALLSAALATGTPRWRAEALALAHACARRSIEDARIVDAPLCHGAFGAAHLFNRLAHATGEDIFTAAAERWLDHGIGLREQRPIAGFPTFDPQDQSWTIDAAMVSGASGIALTLHAMITEVEPTWDRRMLVDLPTSLPADRASATR
jgi:hypothetical protein